jgi:signal transduction histidine kinase
LEHGGDMWVEPVAGRGARFSFRLPAVAPVHELVTEPRP